MPISALLQAESAVASSDGAEPCGPAETAWLPGSRGAALGCALGIIASKVLKSPDFPRPYAEAVILA